MDNFSGIYQAWSAIIDINTIGISNNNNEIPSAYSLQQNYPNPFNPSTTINYSIPKTRIVSFRIFNILGREIYHENKITKPGNYAVNFDGSNLPSGIYFYKMESGDFSKTLKMILVK